MTDDPDGEKRFRVYPGVPEIRERWEELKRGHRAGILSREERRLLKQWAKAIRLLRRDPSHPGLRTHEIEPLTQRYGRPVFQSYLGQGERAYRLYWVYGPDRREITVVGLEPHPEDASGSYDRISLSDLPETP